MKKKMVIISAFLIFAGPVQAGTQEQSHDMHSSHNMHQQHGAVVDGRTSLNLSPAMKQHQLQNMRAHLKAIQKIIAQLGQKDFTGASQTAHQKLGLSKEMEAMCNRFDNDSFKTLAINFHTSADEMAEVFEKENLEDSLAAVSNTMNYCVSCHKQFRQ
ncbi:MAG: cytochrome c [Gammaproteobacteria bacterium]|nr:cytochrome c [Gammaproteobacteria bacterium]